jgi:hypothetical protein
MANYYMAMVHMGESTSEFAHQIELVSIFKVHSLVLISCVAVL